jgi:hypothetical protein
MSASCPISNRKIDENSARLNSVLVAIICSSALLFELYALSLLLFVDFGIKSLDQKYSPLSKGSSFFLRLLGVSKKEIDYAPKRFAAFLGSFLFGCSFTLWYFGLYEASAVVPGAIILCAVLEATISYCVGCKIYDAIISLGR